MTWWKRIAEARARGSRNNKDIKLAGNWVTCACGEQDVRIPRGIGCGCSCCKNMPEDTVLQELGGRFAVAVYANDFDEATRLLAAIEGRAAVILAELGYSDTPAADGDCLAPGTAEDTHVRATQAVNS